MKALLYQGPRDIRCETFDDPKLASDRDAIVKMTRCGRLHPERFVSHEMPLSEGAEAYRLFDAREGGTLKMVMTA